VKGDSGIENEKDTVVATPRSAPSARRSEPSKSGRGNSIASLILGIFAVVLLSILTGIPAIALGADTLRKRKPGRRMALAGVLLGSISCLVYIVCMIVAFVVERRAFAYLIGALGVLLGGLLLFLLGAYSQEKAGNPGCAVGSAMVLVYGLAALVLGAIMIPKGLEILLKHHAELPPSFSRGGIAFELSSDWTIVPVDAIDLEGVGSQAGVCEELAHYGAKPERVTKFVRDGATLWASEVACERDIYRSSLSLERTILLNKQLRDLVAQKATASAYDSVRVRVMPCLADTGVADHEGLREDFKVNGGRRHTVTIFAGRYAAILSLDVADETRFPAYSGALDSALQTLQLRLGK
jgi:hypothetical protein